MTPTTERVAEAANMDWYNGMMNETQHSLAAESSVHVIPRQSEVEKGDRPLDSLLSPAATAISCWQATSLYRPDNPSERLLVVPTMSSLPSVAADPARMLTINLTNRSHTTIHLAPAGSRRPLTFVGCPVPSVRGTRFNLLSRTAYRTDLTALERSLAQIQSSLNLPQVQDHAVIRFVSGYNRWSSKRRITSFQVSETGTEVVVASFLPSDGLSDGLSECAGDADDEEIEDLTKVTANTETDGAVSRKAILNSILNLYNAYRTKGSTVIDVSKLLTDADISVASSEWSANDTLEGESQTCFIACYTSRCAEDLLGID
jgi:hypothetical protein